MNEMNSLRLPSAVKPIPARCIKGDHKGLTSQRPYSSPSKSHTMRKRHLEDDFLDSSDFENTSLLIYGLVRPAGGWKALETKLKEVLNAYGEIKQTNLSSHRGICYARFHTRAQAQVVLNILEVLHGPMFLPWWSIQIHILSCLPYRQQNL